VRQISSEGIDLVKAFEGLPDGDPSTVNLDPYMDPIGIWSAGFGHAIFVDYRPLRGPADRARAKALYPNGLTRQEAELLLIADLVDTERAVHAQVAVPLDQHQFDALVSFTFNLGSGNLSKSTLLRKLNAQAYEHAANEFPRWNRAGGKVLKGLTRRRKAEQRMFRGLLWA
jgi:lysozyme